MHGLVQKKRPVFPIKNLNALLYIFFRNMIFGMDKMPIQSFCQVSVIQGNKRGYLWVDGPDIRGFRLLGNQLHQTIYWGQPDKVR